jgi:hypothetical protein
MVNGKQNNVEINSSCIFYLVLDYILIYLRILIKYDNVLEFYRQLLQINK